MKKILSFILFIMLTLTACNSNNTISNNESTSNLESTKINCYYFDTADIAFTDNILITLNISNDYVIIDTDKLHYKDPIYQIAEFRNNSTSISVFEYNDPTFNFSDYRQIGDTFVYNDEDVYDPSQKTFYTQTNKCIVGISIGNIYNNTLSLEDAVKILNTITGQNLEIREKPKSLTVEGSLENPAKLNEWVSTYIYNNISKEYEPVLISITKVYRDKDNYETTRYNNLKHDFYKNNEDIKHLEKPDISENNYQRENIIFKYSVYYPSTYETADEPKITDTTIPISICDLSGQVDVALNGELDLSKTVVIFNDIYKNYAVPGEDFVDGIGTYKMSKGYEKYLIRIDVPENSAYSYKYFSIKE